VTSRESTELQFGLEERRSCCARRKGLGSGARLRAFPGSLETAGMQKIAASTADFIQTPLGDGTEKRTSVLETALSAWRNYPSCEGI